MAMSHHPRHHIAALWDREASKPQAHSDLESHGISFLALASLSEGLAAGSTPRGRGIDVGLCPHCSHLVGKKWAQLTG